MDVASPPVRSHRTNSLRTVLDLRVSTNVGAVPRQHTILTSAPVVPPDQTSINKLAELVHLVSTSLCFFYPKFISWFLLFVNYIFFFVFYQSVGKRICPLCLTYFFVDCRLYSILIFALWESMFMPQKLMRLKLGHEYWRQTSLTYHYFSQLFISCKKPIFLFL